MMTLADFKPVLRYDRETGSFTWLVSRGKARAGSIAGTIDEYGYVVIRYLGFGYKAHRLVWLFEHGEWPPADLDHRDEVKKNNRIGNLRTTTAVLNGHNITPPNANSSSGLRGVSWYGQYQQWKGSFQLAGKSHFVGHFDDKHAAYVAVEAARLVALDELCSVTA